MSGLPLRRLSSTRERKPSVEWKSLPTKLTDKQLAQRDRQRESCLAFIEVIIFMAGFLVLMWTHEDIGRVYELEHVLKLTLSKPFGEHSRAFMDIQDVGDVWEWVDGGLLPAIVKHEDEVGHILPHEQWGYLASYNRIIGGVRVYQKRGESHTCHYHKTDHLYGECQPLDSKDMHSFGYPDCDDAAAVAYYASTHERSDDDERVATCYNASMYAESVDLHNDEGFTYDETSGLFEMWIDLFDEEDVIHKRVDYLKDRHWIDKQTKEVSFSIFVLNAQEEPLVAETKLSFEFTRVGSVLPSMTFETVPMSPYFADKEFKIILEVLFVGILIHLLHTEYKEIRARRARRKALSLWAGSGQKKRMFWREAIVEHFWSGDEPFSNVVDLATMVLGFWIVAMWVVLVGQMAVAEAGLKHLHRPEGEVAYDDTDHDVWSDYHHEVTHVEHLIMEVVHSMVTVRRLAFAMIVLMIFLMFKTWDGIPAMQGVSATIRNASARLLSFGIILVFLITLFAGSAMLAFGTHMEEFHSFSDAFVTTLIIIATGTEDIYELQYAIDPALASMWHWLLVCIMYVVCLNLVLCILVDAYAQTQLDRDEAEKDSLLPTLSEQCSDTAYYCYESMRDFVFKKREKTVKPAPEPKKPAPWNAHAVFMNKAKSIRLDTTSKDDNGAKIVKVKNKQSHTTTVDELESGSGSPLNAVGLSIGADVSTLPSSKLFASSAPTALKVLPAKSKTAMESLDTELEAFNSDSDGEAL